MTDKQINRWLRRQFSPIGWVLLGYYAVLNILCILAMLWEALIQMYGQIGQGSSWIYGMDMDAIAGNAWGYIMAILTCFLILHAWKGPGYWHQVCFVKEKPMRPGVFFAAACLCVGSQTVNGFWIAGLEWLFGLSGKSLAPVLEAVSGSTDTFSMFLYASILAPVWEELLFRGYVLRTLRPYGKRFAIFGSAVLFGLFHGNLLQTPYAFLIGLLLGYVAMEYSLGWAIALHGFNNLVLADLLTRFLGLLPAVAAQLVDVILMGGCLAASGVILGVKRHQIISHLQSEWMDRRVLKCFFTSAGFLALAAIMVINILTVLP